MSSNVLVKIVLITIAGFLVLAGLRWIINTPVEAQSPNVSLYIEPGTIPIRAPDSGGAIGDGKMVIDLKTGNVWGFPTNVTGSPYPIDSISGKPGISKPVYLGRFDFSEMKTP
jgi:hypothetical protein